MEKEENLDEIFDLKPIIPEIYSSHHTFSDDRSRKTQISDNGSRKANTKSCISSWNSCHSQETISCVNPSSSPAAVPKLISFDQNSKNSTDNMDHNSSSNFEDYCLTSDVINFSSNSAELDDSAKGKIISQKRVSTPIRSPSQAQDHLMAERKRRETLSQLFISLSKVVPGLKKLDKASLLEDGINYLKALQERVRLLEEEEDETKQSSIDTSKDDSSSNKDDNSAGITSQSAAPEIQARISEKHVLIKIFCKKEMGLMSRIPCEIEKIHLNVIDIRIMPFGGAALDITILAEMQSEFEGTVKDIVDHLHTIFLNPRDNIVKDYKL